MWLRISLHDNAHSICVYQSMVYKYAYDCSPSTPKFILRLVAFPHVVDHSTLVDPCGCQFPLDITVTHVAFLFVSTSFWYLITWYLV